VYLHRHKISVHQVFKDVYMARRPEYDQRDDALTILTTGLVIQWRGVHTVSRLQNYVGRRAWCRLLWPPTFSNKDGHRQGKARQGNWWCGAVVVFFHDALTTIGLWLCPACMTYSWPPDLPVVLIRCKFWIMQILVQWISCGSIGYYVLARYKEALICIARLGCTETDETKTPQIDPKMK